MRVRDIPREEVLNTIESPQQRIDSRRGRQLYQSRYFDSVEQKDMIIRAIVEPQGDDLIVISVYKTSKIEKYWLEA